jgi:hypothetical protein
VNGILLPKRIGSARTVTMISLTADELSMPLSLPNSIRDIALRFFLNTFVLHYGSKNSLHISSFSVLYCFLACSDVYEVCIHTNAVNASFVH